MRPLTSSMNRLSRLLTPDNLAILDSQGYLVIDQALPARTAQQLHDEIVHCYDAGHMDSNHTAYVQSNHTTLPASRAEEEEGQEEGRAGPVITRLFTKPNIYEAELLPSMLDNPAISIPTLAALSSHLLPWLDSYLSELLPALLLYSGHSSIKLQLNSGNGSFPFHYDSPGNRTDTRRLTVLLYLNSGWRADDGGEMVLQPWLQRRVKVAPVMNRLLIFRSDRLLHRVEPSHTRRVCLTMWLHGRACDPPLPALGEVGGGEEERLLAVLSHPAYQRALSKVLYASEWRSSYAHAHRGSGADELIASLDADVRRLMAGERGVGRLVQLLQEVVDEKANSETVRGWGEGDVVGGEEEQDEEDEVEETTTDDNEATVTGGGSVDRAAGASFREVSADECGFLDFL